MNCYSLQQNAFAACDVMRGSVPNADQDPVICPKPRRVGVLSDMPIRPFRWNLSQQTGGSDSKAGAELLDIILRKENHGEEYANLLADSPPYFCGSPPVRAANPLVQDARFGDEKNASILGNPSPSELSPPSSASRKGGCARMKFGPTPAVVRVEGFDFLNRDRQNSSISAFA